jgi:hypothetical protein
MQCKGNVEPASDRPADTETWQEGGLCHASQHVTHAVITCTSVKEECTDGECDVGAGSTDVGCWVCEEYNYEGRRDDRSGPVGATITVGTEAEALAGCKQGTFLGNWLLLRACDAADVGDAAGQIPAA